MVSKNSKTVTLAITREVSASIAQCELTHLERTSIDVGIAREQHRAYENALISAGCELRRLPELPECPDAVFVEDTAIVLRELAIVTRPGAESRRPETDAVATVLRPLRKLSYIREPGTVDGGDVLVVDKTLFVGISGRTNDEGIQQIRAIVEPVGYRVITVQVNSCLHLKSAVCALDDRTLLIHRNWIDADAFKTYSLIDIDPDEPFAANALKVGDRVIYPSAYRKTRDRLQEAGFNLRLVDASELARAEGGVTCCSVLVEV
jgi:dimethylargininase